MGAVRSEVYRKGRRTKDMSLKELRVREVKRYLDDGIPVMWTLFSVDEYNHVANQNTATRLKTSDWRPTRSPSPPRPKRSPASRNPILTGISA